MKPQTRKSLAAAGCGTPGCTHDDSVLYLHNRCHSNTGFFAVYEKETGVLILACDACEGPVGAFQIVSHH